jgi:hypothetical protein
MNRAIAFSLAALMTAASGCARTAPGIELASSNFDLQPLVGQWRGTYSSAQTGRAGTIAFTLNAGESAASGSVVMLPKPDSLLTPEEREIMSNVPERTVLKIHFVRKEGGSVSGALDPYPDPVCSCIVNTTFTGAFVEGNAIEGSYTTVPTVPGNNVTSGHWRVTRVKRL